MTFDVDDDVVVVLILQFKDNLDWPRGFVSLFPNGSVQLPLQYKLFCLISGTSTRKNYFI